MLEFDPRRLNRLESDAWANFVRKAGAPGAASMFDLILQWVAKLISHGKVTSEVRHIVVGKFYDNVGLMHRGQRMRNETIALAKAMLEQAIDAVSVSEPLRDDASRLVRPPEMAGSGVRADSSRHRDTAYRSLFKSDKGS